MSVIGFHFNKMLVEKKKPATGKINVSSNVQTLSVKEAKVSMGATKQKGVELTFSFKVMYEPGVAAMDLECAIVYLADAETVKKTLDMWVKEKKVPKEAVEEVYNYILEKCNVEALILAKEMQLPAHLPMPKITAEEQK